MWQVSGAHGYIEPAGAIAEMFAYHDFGLTILDLADITALPRSFIGNFRRQFAARHGVERLSEIRGVHQVGSAAGPDDEARRRQSDRHLALANGRRIHLLQFHWWDYSDENYLDALEHLADVQHEGKIRHLVMDSNTKRLAVIADRVRIVSNQVQYSLIDRRPEVRMASFCREHAITLLAYGTLLGGLLSEKYLARPEPRRPELNTASLQKYKNMVDAWGGWTLFQELLAVLKQIADKHRVSIANVAVRYVLDRPAVAGVIVGARLGAAQHIAENTRVFGFALDAGDLAVIEAILVKSRDLTQVIGDCGDEYR